MPYPGVHAKERPQHPAVVDSETGKYIDYATLDARSNRVAQFIHWLLITLSGTVFLTGYFSRWRYTPLAMIVLFASLATLCAIETFDFMTNPSRYWDFARECTYYILMSIYLVRSKRMRERFGQIMIAEET